ncbi:MAG: anti-sigma factor family protein [Anaerolineae bacterium]
MDCRSAGHLMSEVLEGQGDPDPKGDLPRHVATCSECRAEWARLKAVDALLRAQSLVDPPGDFTSATLRRVERETRTSTASPDRVAPLDALLVLAGAAATAGVGASLVNQEGLVSLIDGIRVLARGMQVLAPALLQPAPAWVSMSLNVVASLAIAVAWFGALVVPRQLVGRPYSGAAGAASSRAS